MPPPPQPPPPLSSITTLVPASSNLPPPSLGISHDNNLDNHNDCIAVEDAAVRRHSQWQHMTRTLHHYNRLEQIGEGTYGQVYRAVCRDTGRIVALKKMRLHHGGYWGMPLQLVREIKILKRLRHPNVLSMIEVVTSKGVEQLDRDDEHATYTKSQQRGGKGGGKDNTNIANNNNDLQNNNNGNNGTNGDRISDAREAYKGNLFLVLEYISHDLTGLLDVGHVFDERQIKTIFQQLLRAIAFLHEHKYVHRDIKSSNILLDSNYNLKLADFGLARSLEPPILDQVVDRASSLELTNKVITLWYRPPEILLGATQYTTVVDVWSAGCILAELCLGRPLVAGKTEIDQLTLIADVTGTPTDDDTLAYLSTLKRVRAGELTLPSPRPSKLDKYASKMPLEALRLLQKTLEWDPRRRVTAANALRHRYFRSAPYPAEDPSELGTLQGPHFHEFQTKQKRREAKAAAERAKADVTAEGGSDDAARQAFDTVYRTWMRKVATEGLGATVVGVPPPNPPNPPIPPPQIAAATATTGPPALPAPAAAAPPPYSQTEQSFAAMKDRHPMQQDFPPQQQQQQSRRRRHPHDRDESSIATATAASAAAATAGALAAPPDGATRDSKRPRRGDDGRENSSRGHHRGDREPDGSGGGTSSKSRRRRFSDGDDRSLSHRRPSSRSNAAVRGPDRDRDRDPDRPRDRDADRRKERSGRLDEEDRTNQDRNRGRNKDRDYDRERPRDRHRDDRLHERDADRDRSRDDRRPRSSSRRHRETNPDDDASDLRGHRGEMAPDNWDAEPRTRHRDRLLQPSPPRREGASLPMPGVHPRPEEEPDWRDQERRALPPWDRPAVPRGAAPPTGRLEDDFPGGNRPWRPPGGDDAPRRAARDERRGDAPRIYNPRPDDDLDNADGRHYQRRGSGRGESRSRRDEDEPGRGRAPSREDRSRERSSDRRPYEAGEGRRRVTDAPPTSRYGGRGDRDTGGTEEERNRGRDRDRETGFRSGGDRYDAPSSRRRDERGDRDRGHRDYRRDIDRDGHDRDRERGRHR